MSKRKKVVLLCLALLLLSALFCGSGNSTTIKGKIVAKTERPRGITGGATGYVYSVTVDTGANNGLVTIEVKKNVYDDIPIGRVCTVSKSSFSCGD